MLRRHADAGGADEAPDQPDRRKRKGAKAGKEDEWVDWNTYIGGLFARGYLADNTIQDFVERNLGKILLLLLLILLLLFGSVRTFLKRSLRRSTAPQSSMFCKHTPSLCEHNRFVKSLMYDFRQSRDVVQNPDGSHNVVTPGFNKLDVCEMPVQLYYADKRIKEYWGHILPEQQEGLVECLTPCVISDNRSDSDVLIGMFDPPYEDKEWWQRTAMVTLEAHSMHPSSLAATDMLVSFHKQSDVQVNYLYGLTHGLPCTLDPPSTTTTTSPASSSETRHAHCLSKAVQATLSAAPKIEAATAAPPARMGQRSSKAVMFMSRLCERHASFAQKLIDGINWDLGVDSYGKCYRNSEERSHARYVPDNAEASKERIGSSYKYHIVIENALVDDYVTEKFYEGLKSASLMVYLGAPNVEQYAPASRSFVNVGDFPDVSAVARHLIQIEKNQTLYDSYFTWRRSTASSSSSSLPPSSDLAPAALSREFKDLDNHNFARSGGRSWQCRLCSVYVERYCSTKPPHYVVNARLEKESSFLDIG